MLMSMSCILWWTTFTQTMSITRVVRLMTTNAFILPLDHNISMAFTPLSMCVHAIPMVRPRLPAAGIARAESLEEEAAAGEDHREHVVGV